MGACGFHNVFRLDIFTIKLLPCHACALWLAVKNNFLVSIVKYDFSLIHNIKPPNRIIVNGVIW